MTIDKLVVCYHDVQMRRGFSIFLILFFGLGPLSAFVDSSQDAGLPACCRRHGAHHCAMYAQAMAMTAGRGSDPTPGFSAPPTCPLYHGPTFSMLMPAHALAAATPMTRAEFTRTSARTFEQITAISTPSRSHAGRGPPDSNPS
jgi:hypothetical protein